MSQISKFTFKYLRPTSTGYGYLPISRLSTVGSRAFPVTGPQTWNDLPEDVTSAESLTTFRRLRKKHCSGSLFPTTCWTSTDCLRWTQQ